MSQESNSKRNPGLDSSIDDHSIHELVEQCLSFLEAGDSQAMEKLLEVHQEHAPAIRRQLAQLEKVGLLKAPQGQDRPPDQLGPFRLQQKLGGGGMGIVYAAIQEPLGRSVALKVIRPDQLFFEGSRQRFRREVEAIARLKHPGIVPIYTVGEEGEVPYYAMELVDGCTVMDALKTLPADELEALDGKGLLDTIRQTTDDSTPYPDPLPDLFVGNWPRTCFKMVEQVASALCHAHGAGILHRDIKPSNLMITRDGRVLLLDFGLASATDSGDITRSGSQLGSFHYMAPEQLLGRNKDIDERTDVYQLGVTLYELLSRTRPFGEEASEVTRKRILDGHFTPIRFLFPKIPWDVETVCLTAMDKDPTRRYVTVDAFLRDIRNVLSNRPINARRPSVALRTKRFVQRHPAWSIGTALGFVLLIGAVVSSLALLSNNRNLKKANADTKQALTRESSARKNAEFEATRAKARYLQALKATEKMLTTVGFDSLRGIPGVSEIRTRLLTDAEAFYIELLEDRPEDDETKYFKAKNHRLLGQIRHDLGNDPQALGSLMEAKEILEPLVLGSQDVVYRQELASTLATMAGILESQGDLDSPLDHYHRCLSLSEDVLDVLRAKAKPKVLDRALLEFGRNLQSLGSFLYARGELEAAERKLSEASQIVDDIVGEVDSLDKELFASATRLSLGSVCYEAGLNDRAEKELGKVIGRASALCQRYPHDPRCSDWLASAQNTLSMLLAPYRPQESYEIGKQSLDRLRTVSHQFDDIIMYQQLKLNALHQQGLVSFRLHRLAEAKGLLKEATEVAQQLREQVHRPESFVMELSIRVSLGHLLEAHQELDEAESVYEGAIEVQQALAETWPEFAENANQQPRPWIGFAAVARKSGRLEIAEERILEALEISERNQSSLDVAKRARFHVFEELANIAIEAGEHERAVEACFEFVDSDLFWEGYRHNAGTVGRALLLLEKDDAYSDEEKGDLAAEYRSVCLSLLSQAVHCGYNGAHEMERAPELAPLRQDTAFQEILEKAKQSR